MNGRLPLDNKGAPPATVMALGFIVLSALAGIIPLVGFALSTDTAKSFAFTSAVWRILVFTIGQAALSTVLSVVPGFFVARALARRRFWGRGFIVQLFAVPLALPAIVAVLSITSLLGGNGFLGSRFPLYGLWGIVLTHVFFNLPLAARVFVNAFERMTPEGFRLGAQLDFSDFDVLRHIDWPALSASVSRVSVLVFLLCAASFVVVLTLGGAGSVTLEVAIYQALRFDFDIPRALSLCVLQVGLSGVLILLTGRLPLPSDAISASGTLARRFDGLGLRSQIWDGFIVIASLVLVVPPLTSLVFEGVTHFSFSTAMITAGLTSFGLGIPAALLAVFLAYGLAGKNTGFVSAAALCGLIIPPAVLATGWFLIIVRLGVTDFWVITSVICLNAMMALPFAFAVIAPARLQMLRQQERLAVSLGIAGYKRFQLLEFPALRPSLLQAGVMALVLSLGDLTALTLLGSGGLQTLPTLVHAQMGHYRSHEAAGTALVLALLCGGLAYGAQRWGVLHDQR